MNESALIVGAGSGLSASLARACASKNMKVALAGRNIEKLNDLKKEIKAETYTCDSSNIESVSKLFKDMDKSIGTPNLVIYNASSRPKRGSVVELDPKETQRAINITCFGAFLLPKRPSKGCLKEKTEVFFLQEQQPESKVLQIHQLLRWVNLDLEVWHNHLQENFIPKAFT